MWMAMFDIFKMSVLCHTPTKWFPNTYFIAKNVELQMAIASQRAKNVFSLFETELFILFQIQC